MIHVLFAALAAGAQAPAPTQKASTAFAVRASVVHLADGTTLDDCVLWVEDGVVKACGRGVEPPPGTPLIVHDGALSAGLVAAHSYSGGRAEVADVTRAVLPDGRLVHAFDRGHGDFGRALAAGITTLVLAPRAWNLVGGKTAVVKTAGGKVLSDGAHLHLALHTTALWGTREPTSWPGALAELERRFAEPEGAFAEVVDRRLPVMIEAWERHEVARAVDFAVAHRLSGALRGGRRAGELVDAVRASGLALIVGPFAPGEDRENLRSVALLAEAGVPLAFGLDSPQNDPEALRFSAALCVREGLDPTTALQALTKTAAEVAGVERRVGRLERGFDADFVLWSGPPIELTSRVVAVYVDGVRVLGGDR